MADDAPSGPLVSVVIPVRDGAATIADTVDAVAAQTYRHLEIIVVDDGSTDESATVVEGLARKDERIVLKRQDASGVVAARNRGIGMANGPALSFCDADDLWMADRVAAQLPALEPRTLVASDVEFRELATGRRIGTFSQTFDRFPGRVARRTGDASCEIAAQNYITTSSVLLWTEDARELGGFRNTLGDAVEDWDLWLRAAERLRFAWISRPLVVIRRGHGSRNMRTDTVRRAAAAVLQDAARRARSEERLSVDMRGSLGLGAFSSRNLPLARRWLGGAVLRRPWNLRWWKWLIATLVWKPVRGRRTPPGSFPGTTA